MAGSRRWLEVRDAVNAENGSLIALADREERAGLDENFRPSSENGYDHQGDIHDDRRLEDTKRRTAHGPESRPTNGDLRLDNLCQ